MHRPLMYQDIAGRRVEVAGSYLFDGGRTIGFSASGYDARHALVIDPQLVYSTYIGGTGNGVGTDTAKNRSTSPDHNGMHRTAGRFRHWRRPACSPCRCCSWR